MMSHFGALRKIALGYDDKHRSKKKSNYHCCNGIEITGRNQESLGGVSGFKWLGKSELTVATFAGLPGTHPGGMRPE